MTSDGTGNAKARTRSAGGPPSSIVVEIGIDDLLDLRRMPSTRRKVKSLVSIRRMRWCSGSSTRANITGVLFSLSFGIIDAGMVSADSRGSTSAALMSSYRLTTHVGLPW